MGQRNISQFIYALDNAFAAYPRYQVALDQAAILADAGLFDDAEKYIQKAISAPSRSIHERIWRDREIKKEIQRIAEMRSIYQLDRN